MKQGIVKCTCPIEKAFDCKIKCDCNHPNQLHTPIPLQSDNTEQKEEKTGMVNYFATVCEKHEFVECELSVTNGTTAGIVVTKTIQCRFCGCLKPDPVKELTTEGKEEGQNDIWPDAVDMIVKGCSLADLNFKFTITRKP